VPWWGVASSAAAPVLLIGGWTAAAELRPGRFNQVRQSVSALAATGVPDRWVMTLVFVLVAICYILTALALRPAATAGRVALIAAGVSGLVVAASPEPSNGQFSGRHAIAAAFGFGLLAVWPLLASRPGPGVPWGLRPKVALGIFFAFLILLAWFVVQLTTGGGDLGLAERALGVVQVFWPVTVVLSCQPFQPVTTSGETIAEVEAGLESGEHHVRFRP
jgi:Protein of unknown function (DUF998)